MWRWFGKKKDDRPPERVRVYDFDTQTYATIPAAELAPGMMRVRMNTADGVEEEVWVEAARLEKNVHQHPPFPEEVRDRFREIQSALAEVYPMSLEQWEDGFRRDQNPGPEIAFWQHVAQVYTRLAAAPESGLGSTLERRQAVYRLLVGCGLAPREDVLTVMDRGPLTREEAERVVEAFYAAEDGDGE